MGQDLTAAHDAWRARMTGNAFDEAGVAHAYVHRAPYAPALFARVLELTAGRACLIDVGCGTGKVAAALAPRFGRTIAIDPSAAMIAQGKRLYPDARIDWMQATAEDAALPDKVDLVTAGAAIHWMKHDVVFPRLAARTGLFAWINNDAPPPWAAEHAAFMNRWLAPLGQRFDPHGFDARMHGFEAWVDVAGRERFAFEFRQPIDEFVEHLHSTATFSRARMGDELAGRFDADLAATVRPFARDEMLSLTVTSDLVWGAPRTSEIGSVG